MAIFHCYVSSPEGTQNAQKFLPGFEFGESPRCAGPCATRGHPGRVSLEDSVPTWCGTESGGFGRGPAGPVMEVVKFFYEFLTTWENIWRKTCAVSSYNIL